MSTVTLSLFAVLFLVSLWLAVPAIFATGSRKIADGSMHRPKQPEALADTLFDSLSDRL